LSVREFVNRRSTVLIVAALVVTGMALILVMYELRFVYRPAYKITQRYFSDDDGASYFADSIDQIPPFDHNGKPAVIAYVFTCGSGSPFIGYLERFTPRGVKALQQARGNGANSARSDPITLEVQQQNDTEYSLPGKGDNGWFKFGTKEVDAIRAVKCPQGDTGVLTPVLP
jgi:hypothetical protein